MTTEREAADPQLDALRRRLYRADATDADVQRYLDERGAEVAQEAPAPTAPPSRPTRRVAILAGTVAVVAVTAGVLLQRPTGVPKRADATTPTTVATPAIDAASEVDIGEGQLLAVLPGAATGPEATAITIDGAATAAQRFSGTGNAVVMVDLPDAELSDQRAAVVLFAEHPAAVRWRALRLSTRQDWSSFQQVVATGRATTQTDPPHTFRYAAQPPTRIAVEAPAGLQWTLVTAAATASKAALH